MDEDVVTTDDLLDAWREATRAAELAERLARLAEAAAKDTNESAAVSEEIAGLAERAADAATRAAKTARNAANRGAALAKARREGVSNAQDSERGAREMATTAKDEYDRAETEAHDRHEVD